MEEGVEANGLSKTYPPSLNALQSVSLSCSNEILGLLGPNGAGKSTLFNILTTLIPQNSGSFRINGKQIRSKNDPVFRNVGVCPQFDSQWENLTVVQQLSIIGKIKGLKGQQLTDFIDYLLTMVNMNMFRATKTKNLSGGNRRKLSFAMSLIGNPSMIFLDECTTGLDPLSRNMLWDTLRKYREASKSNTSVMVSTHSLSEAERNCNTIGYIYYKK